MTDSNFSYDELNAALSVAGVGVWSWDVGVERVRWSPQCGRIFGLAPAEFPTNTEQFFRLVHPDDAASVRSTIERAFTEGEPGFATEYRVISKDRGERWVRDVARIERTTDDKPIRVNGIVQDISEEHAATQALKENEEQLRIFSELASDYVYVVHTDTGVLTPSIVAGSFERVTGYTIEEVAAKGGWTKIMHPDDLAASEGLIEKMGRGVPFVNEYRITSKLGDTRWLRDHVRPVVADGKLIRLVGGVQDITERKLLQEQLQESRRLDALALIAGGVAHDFNNILMVIGASTELLQRRLQKDSEALALAEEISLASQHAAQLTGSLLAFGRRSAASPRQVSVLATVKSALPLLTRAMGENIQIELKSSEDATVEIDPGQLQLVLLNLALNARDAMEHGGLLQIHEYVANDIRRQVPEVNSDVCAILEIVDNGLGMERNTLERLFEPFFTTKPPGKGNGLGLASCHGIITQAGGAIRVESEPGKGARFRLYLPAVKVPADSAKTMSPSAAIGGSEHILLLEDEPALRGLIARMIKSFGYTVWEAGSVRETREAFAQENFDLLVSDIRVPDGNGLELSRELRRQNPNLRCLLISGYVEESQQEAARAAGLALLAKPFGSAALARSIREALRLD